MSRLLRAEVLKLRTTRTFVTLTGLAVATSVLVAVLVALLTEPTEASVLVDVYASDTSSLFILVLGVIGITGEWRHRTITSSLLAAPDRLRFLTAKAGAYAVAGFAVSLAVAALVTVVGTVALSARGLPLPDAGELVAQYARNALLAAVLGALGVAIGGIARNQVAALVVVFVVMFVVEPVVTALAPGVGRYGPFGALSVAAAGLPQEAAGMPENIDLLAVPTAVLALLAWLAALFVVAAALLRGRDLE